MEQDLLLSERVYTSIVEAEWRAALIQDLEREAPLVALSFVLDWQEAAHQAIELCRLANRALPEREREALIGRLEVFAPNDDLWEHYTLAEWFDM